MNFNIYLIFSFRRVSRNVRDSVPQTLNKLKQLKKLDVISHPLEIILYRKYGGFTPWLYRVFRSFLNHVSKTILYIRRNSYVATRPNTISFPPSHGDVYFNYSFAFKKRYRKSVDCYTTYTFY